MITIDYLRVSSSHATTDVLKTDAPINVIWDIFRKYLTENAEFNLDKTDKSTPKYSILSDKQGETKCSYDITNDPGWTKLKNVLRLLFVQGVKNVANRLKYNKTWRRGGV